MFAESVVKTLQDEKFSVKTIYDDDLNFKGKKISNIPIEKLPKNNFKKTEVNKKVFIICNFDKKIFLSIRSKLIKKGFPKNKILHLFF